MKFTKKTIDILLTDLTHEETEAMVCGNYAYHKNDDGDYIATYVPLGIYLPTGVYNSGAYPTMRAVRKAIAVQVDFFGDNIPYIGTEKDGFSLSIPDEKVLRSKLAEVFFTGQY